MIKRAAVLAAALMACGLCACDKMTQGNTNGKSSVKVNVSSKPATKALGVTSDSEYDYSSVQVFVFNEDGSYDTDGYATVDTDGKYKLELMVSYGKNKPFYAVTNHEKLTSIASEDDFLDVVSELKENSVGSLVMLGKVKTDVEDNFSLTIHVSRLVAKVELDKISVNFTNKTNTSLTVRAVYLSNVNSEVSFGGEAPAAAADWLNQRGYSSSACNSILYESWTKTIADMASDNTVHVFYCYPNPVVEDTHDEVNAFTQRCTRLVLDTDHGYYHVDLSDSSLTNGLESNKVYLIEEIIIKGEGASTPEEHPQSTNATCTIRVVDWETGASYTETL